MHDEFGRLGLSGPSDPAPWTTAGGPDFGYDEAVRQARRSCLTDPRLVERFRRVEPHAEPVYERMIRVLDLVWECPDDETVNVVGYRCAGCGSSREVATLAARCREGGLEPDDAISRAEDALRVGITDWKPARVSPPRRR